MSSASRAPSRSLKSVSNASLRSSIGDDPTLTSASSHSSSNSISPRPSLAELPSGNKPCPTTISFSANPPSPQRHPLEAHDTSSFSPARPSGSLAPALSSHFPPLIERSAFQPSSLPSATCPPNSDSPFAEHNRVNLPLLSLPEPALCSPKTSLRHHASQDNVRFSPPASQSVSSASLYGQPVPQPLPSRALPNQTAEPTRDPQRIENFDDQVARQAEAIRQERLSRRIDHTHDPALLASSSPTRSVPTEVTRQPLAPSSLSDPPHPKDHKGKWRASGPTSDNQNGVMVGNLIGEGHANYVLMYNMLTGIRIGVSRCQAKVKRPLTDVDYAAKHKFSFDIVGNELTPSAKYDFKFKDYAPWVFRELREHFYLDPADYLLSLTAKYILSELGSPGKSGSFFYFSRDYRFIIKTIHHAEHKFLRSILRDYHTHVKANPHTLLSRFYGLHRVKLPRGRKIHFVIMNNLFPPHRDIHETFDLKGSAIGREYPEDKARSGAVLKDLNWLYRGRAIDLGPMKKGLFEEQLKRDTELLQHLGIMDYSLLIGLHDMSRGNRDRLRDDQLRLFQPVTNVLTRKPTQVRREQELAASALRKAVQESDPQTFDNVNNRLPLLKDRSERKHFIFYQDEGGFQATDADDNPLPMIYYLGVIDILTPYTVVKKFEHFWKGMSSDKHMISAVPPDEYGNRFLDFLFSIIRGGDVSIRPRMERLPLHQPHSQQPLQQNGNSSHDGNFQVHGNSRTT